MSFLASVLASQQVCGSPYRLQVILDYSDPVPDLGSSLCFLDYIQTGLTLEEVSMDVEKRKLEHILDGNEEPTNLTLALLNDITNDFSVELKIGEGGSASVYKGVLGERKVAVKKIHVNIRDIKDHQKQFRREYDCLWDTNHPNVVRFLGYCSNKVERHVSDESGKMIWAEQIERFFCFEYISKGSLDKHITDELRGLEWETRYGIITGICEGMRYLHEEKQIIHMDLKPANILLDRRDKKYIAKIADFGLSRPNENSHTVGQRQGTPGYWSPEYLKGGKTIPACDIYSLGAIILELVTGGIEIPNKDDVLKNWTQRWNKPPTSLQYQQVTRCIDIAVRCRENEPGDRPSMLKIISFLSESESTYGQAKTYSGELQQGTFKVNATGETSSKVSRETTKLLDIHPTKELRVPFVSNKVITCPLYLTNITDYNVAFRLQREDEKPMDMYYHEWHCGAVPPRSTYTVNVTMKEQEKKEPPPQDNLIIESTLITEDKIIELSEAIEGIKIAYNNFFDGIDNVHKLMLEVVFDPQGATTTEIIPMSKYKEVFSVDVHLTEPWILISHSEGHFRIWNYKMKEMVHTVISEPEDMSFWTSKFAERKQLIVAGNGRGYIHVYKYNMERVMRLQTHEDKRITCLAIHPTEPYVLSVSHADDIKMFDWEKRKIVQVFKGKTGCLYQIAFNPKDANTFATVSEEKIKIWSIGSPDHITLGGHEGKVRCLDYFTRADKQYLITGSDDGVAKIWDLQKECCVETLKGHTKRVSTVCSHPTLSLLMTGSWDGTVRLWDSNSFRLKGTLNFHPNEVHALGRIMEGPGRCGVVIGYSYGLAIMSHEDVARSSEHSM